MAGISARAIYSPVNKNQLFQDQPLDDELGLNWYGFKYRNHDPQIGRFIQVDPLSEKYVHNSTYAFSENKVTAHVELEGLEGLSINAEFFKAKLLGSTGITKSYSGKEFAQDMGEAAKNPEVYKGAALMVGQVAVLYLAGVMTEGMGSGSLMTVGTRSIGRTVSASVEVGEVSVATRATVAPEVANTAPAALDGSFSIADWSKYPTAGNVPKPQGPFRLLEGTEYSTARSAANSANSAMHKADPSLSGKQIHEIQPVKFGGSPTDATNKIPLAPKDHAQYTNWWNMMMRNIQSK